MISFLGLDGRVGLSFTQGMLATINPCGFVLLPTYLMFFLGMESSRPGVERAPIRRALKVSLAVSAGFMLVFIVIGAIVKLSSSWLVAKSAWVSLAIGIALIVLGIAMILGYRLPLATPKLDIGERDRSVQSMFVFGIAYAIASLGCTIGPFTGTVLGAFSTDNAITGIAAVAMYGVGMAIVVVGLTVALAMANTALLGFLRRGMSVFEYIAGIFVLLTGLYLTWYWYISLSSNFDDPLVARAEGWQSELARWVNRNETAVVVVLLVLIAGAIGYTILTKRRTETPAP